MPLASRLAPPAPTSVSSTTGPPRQEEAGPLSLADWLATHPDPVTLPRCFAALLHRDPPAHDGRTYRSPINPEDPTAPRRVRRGNRAGRIPRELAAMRAEEEARRAAVAEEGGTTATSTSRRSPTPSEMEGVELQNPFSSALSTAAPSGVLHLVGQQNAPSTSTQTQDFDEEMDDPPRSWTLDEDDEWGMGPPI
ncbi:hypothetical protein DFH08DRAFT_819566 [Mycena albidolilacea]|uniref:Uncharacterized protein n=1 Tax=Mycena albidolilacea TaxID=1033008 RepID=A0AAD6ZEL7_9AGAR|nr:hypothetical protein DFH08DRAFT_819566 [Mycena albidolilacea]